MANETAVLTQKVSEIVERAPGRRVLLSTLGLLLQQHIAGFNPVQYGHRSLKELFMALPGFASLIPGEHPGQWWLTLGPAEASSQFVSSAVTDKVLPHVWERVIDFDPGVQIWFDLEGEQLVTDREAFEREPDRYLTLPRFALGRQIELAREWCREQDEAHRSSLLATLSTEGPMDAFLAETTRLRLRPAWNHYRGERIAQELFSWARNHGVAPTTLFGSRRALRSSERRTPPRAHGLVQMGLGEYRQLLHRMIDAMTDEELLQFAVPGRFIVTFSRD